MAVKDFNHQFLVFKLKKYILDNKSIKEINCYQISDILLKEIIK